MRLLRLRVIAANTCGGLLDGFTLELRNPTTDDDIFAPVCLIGPNGAGKSQVLQVIAEMLQSVFHAVVNPEERVEGNPDLEFELEYLIRPSGRAENVHVRVARQREGKRKPIVVIQKQVHGQWINCPPSSPEAVELLPRKVVGYTSGDNETLSLPFLLSRSGYADEVGKRALSNELRNAPIPDTRLMLIDYGTHLEVLVSNLLLGTDPQRAALLRHARLNQLHSFRCIVQLAHSAAPQPPARRSNARRKRIQLTQELEDYLDQLQRCATCYYYEDKTETYVFDFFINEQTETAFQYFWKSALDLYSAFHKLAMLNDLAIPRATRERFRKDTKERRFASRLPEPQDEDKVFRFERVNFYAQDKLGIVDYVSLSDGEHQLAQLLGTFAMVSYPNVLFLLDEPESHFNPQWRVKFISRLLDLPTSEGTRGEASPAAQQDGLLTTHAPFVPSDMARENVFIFSKDADGRITARQPEIETYGTTFDSILGECFGVRPPISEVPRQDIDALKRSNDPDEIREGLDRLGSSIEKIFLVDRLRQLTREE